MEQARNAQNDTLEFVSTIITDKQGRPLLLKRLDTLKLDPGKYDMCSGHMKKGECPMQSMYRELREEVGMMHYDMLQVSKLGDIATPHPMFQNTICHMYHIITNLTEEQINENIEKTEDREMEYGKFLNNIDELRTLQRDTSSFRTPYTKEMEHIYQLVEEKVEDRKEWKERECEEK